MYILIFYLIFVIMCLTFRCFHISTYYIYLFLGKNCGIAVFCLNDFLRINCSVVTGEQRFIGMDVYLRCRCFKFSVALFVCLVFVCCVCSCLRLSMSPVFLLSWCNRLLVNSRQWESQYYIPMENFISLCESLIEVRN